jgi:hypothetical protein
MTTSKSHGTIRATHNGRSFNSLIDCREAHSSQHADTVTDIHDNTDYGSNSYSCERLSSTDTRLVQQSQRFLRLPFWRNVRYATACVACPPSNDIKVATAN